MKWIIIFLAVVCLTHRSGVTAQTINFTGTNVPLEKVFSTIKTQTGYVFFYNEAFLNDTRPVSVQLKNANLQTALTEIFKDQPVTWSLEGQTITLVAKQVFEKTTPAVPPRPGRGTRVSGFVTDVEGRPLENSSVIVKKTNRGKLTDSKGGYSIQAGKSDVLVFSSVGYSSKEVTVSAPHMNIVLQLELKPLETLVVGG